MSWLVISLGNLIFISLLLVGLAQPAISATLYIAELDRLFRLYKQLVLVQGQDTIPPMFNIVLFQPEIPPNTGNVIRLCANTGCRLHLVAPLGFALEDKKLRRAGLDYHEWADVELHDSLEAALLQTTGQAYALSTRGQTLYSRASFNPGDALIFGPETRGLPATFLETLDSKHTLRLPMLENSRSLNLSNTVAVVVYEALRQQEFSGLS